jgi:hypothetical protein
VVDNVVLGQVFFEYFGFPCQSFFFFLLLLLEWLYSPCGPSPIFQFPYLFYSQLAGLLE